MKKIYLLLLSVAMIATANGLPVKPFGELFTIDPGC